MSVPVCAAGCGGTRSFAACTGGGAFGRTVLSGTAGAGKAELFLEPNPNPCLVYQGSAQRDIPEETNGYLFSVSCEGDTVYFDWYHFLMDGHGVSPFLTRILEQYCNLRYGTAFANTPILCSPAYDIEAMMENIHPSQPPRARCRGMWCRHGRAGCAAPGCG